MMSQVELIKLAKMRGEMVTCTTPQGPAPGAHEYKYENKLKGPIPLAMAHFFNSSFVVPGTSLLSNNKKKNRQQAE